MPDELVGWRLTYSPPDFCVQERPPLLMLFTPPPRPQLCDSYQVLYRGADLSL